jgi:hypothetical protein
MLDMNPDRLAVALADRLAAMVPAGLRVTATDGMLWYTAEPGRFPGQSGDYRVGRAGTYVRDNFSAHGTSDEERAVGVTIQALSELQDYVSEATHLAWPGTIKQPTPHARIASAHLEFWYGGDEPVLAGDPIPCSEIA